MITDWNTFVKNSKNKVFRLLEKRTPGDWTPLEMAEKYEDQDHYVDNQYQKVMIVDSIELPDKDILIGYKVVYNFEDLNEKNFKELTTQYRKLSQIELSYFPYDENEENWDY